MRIRYVGPIGGEMTVVDRRSGREYDTVDRVVDVPEQLAEGYLAQDVWELADDFVDAPEEYPEEGD